MTSKLRIALITAALALLIVAPAGAVPAAPSNLSVRDLVPDPELFDPQLSWAPVTGAKGYEVEINPSSFWASGSKVCCSPITFNTKATTYGTSFSPTLVLPNNTYNWRVRAIDANENAGPWAQGQPFTKKFANSPDPSVQNLRLVDRDLGPLPAGSVTDTPIVLWDPVPGASSYQVIVAPFAAGGCDWAAPESIRWDKETATTGWTPLGWLRGQNADPLSSGPLPADDTITHLVAGTEYCVRVRPVDKESVPHVLEDHEIPKGDWVYLPAQNVPAFTWSGPPPTDTQCDPTSCSLTTGDYLRPGSGTQVDRMPVFTWDPIPGAESYFVVVARDQAFTTIVDYAYTRVPAYAPRTRDRTKGYADETTGYYWAVLPADTDEGHGVSTDPISSAPQQFEKRSTPPATVSPTPGQAVDGLATTFRWTSATGARRYRVQVSDDPTFVNIISEGTAFNGITTDSTAYTSNTAYPTGKKLYWRVQAEAEDGLDFVGLTWSQPASFTKATTGSGGTTTRSKFRTTIAGYPVKSKYRTIWVTVRAPNWQPVYRAAVRVYGGGLVPRTKYTSSLGKVSFNIRATRYPGRVGFRITRSGYYTQYLYRSVRRA
jgi:hypothetical protein